MQKSIIGSRTGRRCNISDTVGEIMIRNVSSILDSREQLHDTYKYGERNRNRSIFILIDLPNLCLSVFDHSFCGTYPVGDICLFLIQLFAGAKAVFLNIDDCPGQFQEIGELHFFCISPVLLRLYASLQIGHQSQFRTDIEDCHRVGMIVVCGVISGWVRGRYGLCDQGQRT